MTAEVAILNKEAIALAADSAGTVRGESGEKIFTSVNKIFMLSKHAPVGIMIYGGADLIGIPWEIIIKVYRDKLGSDTCNTLQDYATDFIDFLMNDPRELFSDEAQENYFRSNVYSLFYFVSQELNKVFKKKYMDKGILEDKEIEQISLEFLDNFHNRIFLNKKSIHSDSEKFLNKLTLIYRNVIADFKRKCFGTDILKHKKISSRLTELALNYFLKLPHIHSNISGIVIAGFGDNEIFPSVKSFLIDGMIHNQLLYRFDEDNSREVNFKNIASIVPFAQVEMMHMFMSGVDPSYQGDIENDLSDLFGEYSGIIYELKTIKELKLNEDKKEAIKKELDEINFEIQNKYIKGLRNYRQERYISPIMEIVSNLPKIELALMAETLINLTSFKRKMSPESETVAEPIDVAIISKGDGFVWIKRKHYFDSKFNHHFFENYFSKIQEDRGVKHGE